MVVPTGSLPGTTGARASPTTRRFPLLTSVPLPPVWRRTRRRCVEFIRVEVAKGKKVYVYGASTKGNVILQYYGLDTS